MAKFLLLVFLLATYTIPIIADGSSPSQSPSPTQSPTTCADVVMGMMDCLSYIEEGSKENKPTPACCNELKIVVNKSPDCLCEGMKLASKFGIKLDMKRATRLPHACGLPLSDFGACDATSVPSPDPVVPSSSPPLSPPPSVSTPPPVSQASPPLPVPTPPLVAPPVSPPTPPQHSPAPPVSPPTPPPKAPLVEPPAQSSQPPSLAPLSSSSWKISCSMLALCVSVAIASFSFSHA